MHLQDAGMVLWYDCGTLTWKIRRVFIEKLQFIPYDAFRIKKWVRRCVDTNLVDNFPVQ